MKNLVLLLTFGIICSMSNIACTQNNGASTVTPSNLVFSAQLRTDGSAFYAMNNKTGQMFFMLDYGETRGSWKPFGPVLREGGGSALLFQVVERLDSRSFYALDSQTGQLYFSNDGAEPSVAWTKYGTTIRSNGVNALQFTATGRTNGNSFYAFDSQSGQMYFMNDFDEDAGTWKTYGDQLK